MQPTSLTIDLEEQSCTRKETISLHENTAILNNDNKSDKANKDFSETNSDSSRKIISKKKMNDKKTIQSKGVAVILGDSIIKGEKDWKLTN